MSNEGLTQRMETFDVKLNQNKELMQESFYESSYVFFKK